jgi:hypothetical protein
MGHLVQAGCPKWPPEELVFEQSPAPTAIGQAWELGFSFLVHSFSLRGFQIQLTTSFSKVEECFIFTRQQLCTLPPLKLGQLSIPSHPTQAERSTCSIYLTTSFVCGRVQFAHQLPWTVLFSPDQLMCHTHLVVLQFYSALGQQG